MRKQIHILNGDSLKEQFPDELQDELIVAQECLADGHVEGEDLDDLYKTRAQFIGKFYGFGDLQVKRMLDEIKNKI